MTALGCHECDEAAAGAYVQQPSAFGKLGPCAKQYTIGAYLHGAPVMMNTELLELEIGVAHGSRKLKMPRMSSTLCVLSVMLSHGNPRVMDL